MLKTPPTDKPWHFGLDYKNQTTEWLPTDSQENFEILVKDPAHYKYFKAQGWLEPRAITYQFNSEGFRCDEFEPGAPCMIALGCSYTVGIGLPLKDIWPVLVGKALGLKVYNLGWGGCSADTCYRMARYWIPTLKPQVVCMLTPPRGRLELSTINGTQPPVEVFMPMSRSVLFPESDVYLKHWFGNDDNHWFNQEKNILSIKSIAESNNAKFASINADDEGSCSRDIVGYARDYMHTGSIGHTHMAKTLLIKLSAD
jgi:hypothetical protein